MASSIRGYTLFFLRGRSHKKRTSNCNEHQKGSMSDTSSGTFATRCDLVYPVFVVITCDTHEIAGVKHSRILMVRASAQKFSRSKGRLYDSPGGLLWPHVAVNDVLYRTANLSPPKDVKRAYNHGGFYL